MYVCVCRYADGGYRGVCVCGGVAVWGRSVVLCTVVRIDGQSRFHCMASPGSPTISPERAGVWKPDAG